MTSGHFIYIPMVVLAGVVLGFFLGGRAARDAIAFEQKRKEERERRKERRAARETEKKESSS